MADEEGNGLDLAAADYRRAVSEYEAAHKIHVEAERVWQETGAEANRLHRAMAEAEKRLVEAAREGT